MEFKQLLDLDKDTDLTSLTFSKFETPIYYIIRPHLFNLIHRNKLNLKSDFFFNSKKSVKEWLRYLYISIKKNLFLAPKKPIYFFSIDFLLDKRGTLFKNRIYSDLIVKNKENIQLLNFDSRRSYKTPTRESVYYRNIIHDFAILISKFIPLNKEDRSTIKLFIIKLKEKDYLTVKQYEQLYFQLKQLTKRKWPMIMLYDFFFKIKTPKLIILPNAHYMGDYVYILAAAKRNNIPVAEFQHGYVGKSHYAYNFNEEIKSHVKPFLPDYFLSFGDYWNGRINSPVEKITIGHPELMKKVKSLKLYNGNSLKKKNILFISTTFNNIKLIRLANKMAQSEMHNIYEIKIRPAPIEKQSFLSNYSESIDDKIKVDLSEDLYKVLNDTEIVVSLDFSTVLYEALLFTKKVYIGNTNYVQYNDTSPIFLMYDDFDSLYDSMKKNEKVNVDTEEIWEKNYLGNFSLFIDFKLN